MESQFTGLLRDARRAARAVPGAEICGLLVDTGGALSFVQTRNASRRTGSFVLSGPDVRRIVAAVKILGQEVVGTFHSHPVGEPTPGESDIRSAVDDSLMFIFDCVGRAGRLWIIRSGRAYPLDFAFIDGRQPPAQQSKCAEPGDDAAVSKRTPPAAGL
ncbi:MAG: Mov34/MPN/PAD-1 family protein [Verrucomicrobia bacterium]|nr:Mov34/MPN/PAD-1 family protein [Verrucomicrobiota bacterium]